MDTSTLKHLNNWALRRFYHEDVETKVAKFIAWFESQDSADKEHWINAGWPAAFDAAGIY